MTAIEAMEPGEQARRQKVSWMYDKDEQPTEMASPSPDEEAHAFYRSAMQALKGADIPFLVGGAFALEPYTGIKRYTKDFDIFVRAEHVTRALAALEEAGYRSELTFPHWLGKAYCGDFFVDIIFGSGNGEAKVDEMWFEHAVQANVLGIPTLIYPPEEAIWSKSFVMERERYDGADIAHLIRACAADLDWHRLLSRYGSKWRLLFSYLILFGFIYPGERDKIPAWLMQELMGRLQGEIGTTPHRRR
jgi:hypothetical protein